MGKRYYCDYCDRAFPDSAQNRKKHLQGVHHQKLIKLHYDSFRDAATLLQNEMSKKPCRKFKQTGNCEFGPGCKYSHMSPTDIENLKRAAEMEERIRKEGKKVPIPDFDLDSWLRKHTEKKRVDNVKVASSSFEFPPKLLSIENMTPSLIPARPEEFLSDNIAEWES
ncbi:zinc finger matrin-type protein 5 [Centruroides vittatus]|uniref:zinc finger matrin-type protein 5 n=1 Tax=Centruroides vittatus TaxID=120091 RepID=UPI00350F9321